jgi:hypothetical protein
MSPFGSFFENVGLGSRGPLGLGVSSIFGGFGGDDVTNSGAVSRRVFESDGGSSGARGFVFGLDELLDFKSSFIYFQSK